LIVSTTPDTSAPTEISPEALGFKRDLRLTSSIAFLPPALDIVPQLLVFLADEEKNGEMLAELIRVDPGLTANVLRVANSAAFAGAYRMENLNAAVLRLGLREVYRIVLQVVASPVFLNATQPGASSLDLWKHSVQTAVAAQVMSRWLGEDAELAFTAGLLHDVGKLIFHQLFGNDYVLLVHEARAQNAPVFQREFSRYQADHASVGARLLKRWNFPEPMIHAVQFHHDLTKCPKPDAHLVALIFASNLLAHKLTSPEPFPNQLLAGSAPVLKILGMGAIEDLWAYQSEVKEAFDREYARFAR
jgi:putative nucleotidyltransferase with HDIG domain